ncbi:MAG: phosphate ABC transporter permease PstA [Oscillospiraceae bacterium]|jgi:phosphate transport system permease protein|nr:phosphate ABC transporter permease PstA [Oscillospiraceae bacterium]
MKARSAALRAAVYAAAAITALTIVFLVGYIVVKGAPHLEPELFAPKYTTDNLSMLPAIINTALMTVSALLISGPVGVFAAVYLVEYASRSSRLARGVRLAAETLSGIPSVVYGLFGRLLFVAMWGLSLISGAFTLAIMTLPLIMRTAQEALLSVPDTYREGSFGLGAGKLRTVFAITLPAAAPGILAGFILSVGRIVGETAALIYTAGTVAEMPKNAFSSVRTLSVHMYVLSNEALYVNQSYATALVLMVLVIFINAGSNAIAKKLTIHSL